MSEDGYTSAAPRRRNAGFLEPVDPPTTGAVFRAQSFRERVTGWAYGGGGLNDTLPFAPTPHAIYALYVPIKMALFVLMFRFAVMDATEGVFSEKNAKRFILYSILGDVLGINSTNGPLGFRVSRPFGTWWNFITPGTLTSPLVPGVSGVRKPYHVLAYLIYILLLTRALFTPHAIGHLEVLPIVACLAAITPFDCLIAHASRGEHYGYMLFCLAFPGKQWIFGCQCCQLALWLGAGISKLGPWFKYVPAQMTPNEPLARLSPALVRRLYRDFPKDVNPSALCIAIARGGVAVEIALSLLCASVPPMRTWGVRLACAFHAFIMLQLPFASVQEWNIFCVWSALYFFGEHGAVFDAPPALHPMLTTFLITALLLIPIIGQLAPRRVPFLFAFRPYAGNWRFSWHIVTRAAQPKLRRLKTIESVFFEENDPSGAKNADFNAQFIEYGVCAGCMNFPHLRPLVPIVEKLSEEGMYNWSSANDFRVFFQEQLLNQTMGWCLGTGWHVRPAYFAAMRDVCGFEKGECLIVINEPHGLLSAQPRLGHLAEWYVVDVADPTTYNGDGILRGRAPYSVLEACQPAGMTLAELEKWTVETK